MKKNLQSRPCARPGFTLVEVAIVAVVIGLLATMAIPSFMNQRERAGISVVASDLRTFGSAFQQYFADHGDFPKKRLTNNSELKGLKGYIVADQWLSPTPLGGKYEWRYRDHIKGEWITGIALKSAKNAKLRGRAVSPIVLDREMDDGNLNTGKLRKGQGNSLLYVVYSEPKY
jgi:prepilin-type N-terminal cleavage/methylation domain-containing protein